MIEFNFVRDSVSYIFLIKLSIENKYCEGMFARIYCDNIEKIY